MKSTLQDGTPGTGLHVALIMDGNGRWATSHGWPRPLGHSAGARAIRPLVEAAPALGIVTLSLFAFSADNWRRPSTEVDALMALFTGYLKHDLDQLCASGTRLTFIGRRDRLAPHLVAGMAYAEQITARGDRLHLRIAVDYSARHEITRAAMELSRRTAPGTAAFAELLVARSGDDKCAPDVDLLIRAGGEKRLSDFLLWESAYAELHFTDRLWPDFTASDLALALDDYRRRERRYGGLAPTMTFGAATPSATLAGQPEPTSRSGAK